MKRVESPLEKQERDFAVETSALDLTKYGKPSQSFGLFSAAFEHIRDLPAWAIFDNLSLVRIISRKRNF